MPWDAIIVGSGFGGAMAALELVDAGLNVLMLERGGWVARGPQSWSADGVGLVTPHYDKETPYDVDATRRYVGGSWHCVGGQSVFYGGASYRFRETDFEFDAGVVGASGAAWPFRYADIEPFYSKAEQLLNVAGSADEPTAPPRSHPYPQQPAPLAAPARMIADAATRIGLTASRIPLAISYQSNGARRGCIKCGQCDGYACPAEAKNDLASSVIPDLVRRGMTLRTNTVCVRLVRRGRRITGVQCVNRVTGERELLLADRVILGAGSLATPHLLLASHLAAINPAANAVGRYLTRHRNAVVFGVYARTPNPEGTYDKQVAIFDLYDQGGSIQQLTPPVGLVRAYLPAVMGGPVSLFLTKASGLLVIAEDQPSIEKGMCVDWSRTDDLGLPRLKVRHRYCARDEAAARVLIRAATRIHREAGALLTCVRGIETFSHALGTVRMGVDPKTSPLDEVGRFRGLDNLYITDGSALPRSAGVNPSLTIAANALRIGAHIAREANPSVRVPPRSRRLPVAALGHGF